MGCHDLRRRFNYWDLVRECTELGLLCKALDEIENTDRRRRSQQNLSNSLTCT